MSLLPFVFRDMIRPLRIMEHQMRMAEEFFPVTFPMIRHQRKPYIEASEDTESIIHQDKEKFQVKVDVQNFKPQEITVKTMDGSIVIEGKHEEKQDDIGFIARQFIRKFVLSKDHDLTNVVSTLSSDGILTITAPRKIDPAIQERVVPITQIGADKTEKKNESE